MVKGVNKTVIVVNDTGNEMFEKIVFYVTPKYSKTNLRELKQAAGELSLTFGYTKSLNNVTLRKRHFKKKALIVSAVILLSVTVLSIAAILIF